MFGLCAGILRSPTPGMIDKGVFARSLARNQLKQENDFLVFKPGSDDSPKFGLTEKFWQNYASSCKGKSAVSMNLFSSSAYLESVECGWKCHRHFCVAMLGCSIACSRNRHSLTKNVFIFRKLEWNGKSLRKTDAKAVASLSRRWCFLFCRRKRLHSRFPCTFTQN